MARPSARLVGIGCPPTTVKVGPASKIRGANKLTFALEFLESLSVNQRHAGIGDIDDTEVKIVRQRLRGRLQSLLSDMSIDIEQRRYYGFALGTNDPGILRIKPSRLFERLVGFCHRR